jgi:hypothetical protein
MDPPSSGFCYIQFKKINKDNNTILESPLCGFCYTQGKWTDQRQQHNMMDMDPSPHIFVPQCGFCYMQVTINLAVLILIDNLN